MKAHFLASCILVLSTQTVLYGARAPEDRIPYKHRMPKTAVAAPAPQPEIKIAKDDPYRFEFGGNYTYACVQPHKHTTFHGSLGGAQALFEFRPTRKFYGAGKLTWREGSTHSQAGTRSLFYIDLQERLGFTFASNDKEKRLTLYSGFGYKHIGHNVHPKDGSSLKFHYNHIYAPVGFLADYAFNTWFAVGLDFAWMPQLYPSVKIAPLKGARWILSYQLANFYAELPITFSLTQDKIWTLILNPSYEYWRDGHSTAKTNTGVHLGLPGNTYNFWGIDLTLGYSF